MWCRLAYLMAIQVMCGFLPMWRQLEPQAMRRAGKVARIMKQMLDPNHPNPKEKARRILPPVLPAIYSSFLAVMVMRISVTLALIRLAKLPDAKTARIICLYGKFEPEGVKIAGAYYSNVGRTIISIS